MKKGFMLVCDGSNGAGKTTVIKKIETYLTNKGFDVLLTREPGGTPIGERIRSIILDPDSSEMLDITELMLFGAARAQHIQEKIVPALNQGKVVVCDRFDAATISFQHYARGIDINIINQVNNLALAGFSPDMNIILDLDPIIGLERVKSRGDGLDRMEDEKLDFLNRARDGYLQQAKACPEKFTVIDASQSQESVANEVISVLEQLIKQHSR
ncbi:dTMP kinase [Colwellia sp. D2M02]|uniref:Thymidylate kinase n=1 Tax=Colwellia asteriadis TaxID=517723 RepID=A0ABN1L844_9GAMM|nr:dTMP kinase [Colwellia sp. D2M02]MBU2892591.1 dTMP kinase [Colwellia sp. D2M02]